MSKLSFDDIQKAFGIAIKQGARPDPHVVSLLSYQRGIIMLQNKAKLTRPLGDDLDIAEHWFRFIKDRPEFVGKDEEALKIIQDTFKVKD